MFEPRSTPADLIFNLYILVFEVTGLIFAVVFSLLVYAIAWYRKRAHGNGHEPEIYPVSSGLKGGMAGMVVMAVLACLYGLLKQGSIWYPINLLAAAYPGSLRQGTLLLREFHLPSFLIASCLHVVTSLLVGLLYGAMLQLFPRHPIVLGCLVAPVLWTGLLHSLLVLMNPILNEYIDWWWFAFSQLGYGIAAGLVVIRQSKARTSQLAP
jgi:hypothetical protein